MCALFAIALLPVSILHAQENYFVTYSHELEEPGNLEIAAKNIVGAPEAGNPFVATALEFEYGLKTWWTTELYLDGQTTAGESTVFTGFRLRTDSAHSCASTGSILFSISNSRTSTAPTKLCSKLSVTIPAPTSCLATIAARRSVKLN